jgi:hypothetical protein
LNRESKDLPGRKIFELLFDHVPSIYASPRKCRPADTISKRLFLKGPGNSWWAK